MDHALLSPCTSAMASILHIVITVNILADHIQWAQYIIASSIIIEQVYMYIAGFDTANIAQIE